jgi:DNA-binding transcriptional regulator YdaS (Cro superfamily)
MNEITRTAIERAGGPRAVAPHVKLTRQAVAKWEVIPPKHVLTLERLSGISRYELRPDIYGPKPGPLKRSAAHAAVA